MRLRRVAITGFKTFARHSEVALEPGITAIVGPNGSGKSNLVDAIRWALGETNARELRGARMDEVIYSGGNGRSRMGYAEVELVLDNEEGRIAVDDAEVSVSRRVVRHGDSEFRLNGDRVRLRDLERVLGTTGLTQSGYAVVAQNDIDAIIEATPAQRRALVEQAAGVRALRAASEDALARVGHAEVTLRRFEDLLAETEPRLAELAVQAELAEQQRELSDQLSSLRGSLAREAWRAARAQLRQARRRLESAEGRLAAASAAEAAFAGRLGAHRARLEQHRAGRGAATAALEDARVAAERAAGDQHRSADRARAGVLGRAVAAVELRRATTDVVDREGALTVLTGATAPGQLEAEVAGRRQQAQRRHLEAQEEVERRQAAVAAAEAGLRAAEEERVEAESGLRRHLTQLRLFTDAAQTLRSAVAEAEARVASLRDQAQAAVAAREGSASRLGAASAQAAEARSALEGVRAAVAQAQADLDGARQEARAALARSASMRGRVDGAIGGDGALAAAVAAGDVAGRRLVDCFTVADRGDEPAVEAALEGHLGAWVVEDVDAAAALLRTGGGREEILAAGERRVEPPSPPPGARAAFEAVVPVTGAAAALAHVLGDAWLVADLAAARAAVRSAGGRAVTPDGTVITMAGVRGGGRPGQTLELAAAERAAAEAAELAITAERTAEATRAAATARLATAEAEDGAAAETLQGARIEHVEAAAAASSADDLLAAETRRLEAARAELAAREAERGELAGADAAATARLATAQAHLGELRSAVDRDREGLAAARTAAAEAAEALRAADLEQGRLAAEAADRARRLEGAREAVMSAQGRRSAAAEAVLAAELAVVAAISHGRSARAAVEVAAAALARASAILQASAPELAESERAVVALEAERSEVAVVLARAEDERAAAQLDVEAASERVADLADAVRDDDDDEGPEPEAGDAEKAEREIVRLERRIAGLGPVNALAPGQHEALAARVAVLRAGRDDLGSACADIRAVAARLTRAIDARFEAVFGAVSVHFHELFAELFPGGRATLRREEPPADAGGDGIASASTRRAGVEILAQPPGKRLQPLSLFSGGERALTALAVILALQQVNPSPFYVFDEVDAPLDDSNVLRFTRLLTRLAAEQQFIVVTHNHITMAAADALHGVTSDGDGVSSVISVRFDADSGETVPEGNVVGVRQATIRAAV